MFGQYHNNYIYNNVSNNVKLQSYYKSDYQLLMFD